MSALPTITEAVCIGDCRVCEALRRVRVADGGVRSPVVVPVGGRETNVGYADGLPGERTSGVVQEWSMLR